MPGVLQHAAGIPASRRLDVRILKRVPCVHRHVSGRDCGYLAPASVPLCGFHKAGTCDECQNMLDTFQPPNGWPTNLVRSTR